MKEVKLTDKQKTAFRILCELTHDDSLACLNCKTFLEIAMKDGIEGNKAEVAAIEVFIEASVSYLELRLKLSEQFIGALRELYPLFLEDEQGPVQERIKA